MNRYTLGHVRQSRLPATLLKCASSQSEIAALVNEAQERLLHDPLAPDEGWYGGWVQMVFNVQVSNGYGYIVTPREIARVILMDACRVPIRIRNGFYEYLQFGIGIQPNVCSPSCQPDCVQQQEAYVRDNVYTLSDLLTTPQKIRIYPVDSSDVGKRVLVQGLDQNGLPVTSLDIISQQTISGEYLYLDTPFVDSANEFSLLTGLLKDITLGRITLFQVDPDTGVETGLSSMEPSETAGLYKKYLINGLPANCCNTANGIVQINCQCKLDFIPVMSDPDYLLIQSIPALIEEVQAIRYSSMDSNNSAALEQKHHAKAIQLLNGQLDHFEGKINTAVTVPIFGSDIPKSSFS